VKAMGGAGRREWLRGRGREELLRSAQARERDEARRRALDQILDANSGVEVPESLVEDQIDGELENAIRSMNARGIDPRNAGVDWDEVRKEQREPARRFVRGILLLDAIGSQETLSVDASEVDAALARDGQRRDLSLEAMRARWEKEGRVESLKRQILREKVLDFLLGTANI